MAKKSSKAKAAPKSRMIRGLVLIVLGAIVVCSLFMAALSVKTTPIIGDASTLAISGSDVLGGLFSDNTTENLIKNPSEDKGLQQIRQLLNGKGSKDEGTAKLAGSVAAFGVFYLLALVGALVVVFLGILYVLKGSKVNKLLGLLVPVVAMVLLVITVIVGAAVAAGYTLEMGVVKIATSIGYGLIIALVVGAGSIVSALVVKK